jgi:3-methyladenine DNA glycosylase AlkC
MMSRQARRSALVMGFDTYMIAGSRACSTSTRRLTHPIITNQSSPHYAEALAEILHARSESNLQVRRLALRSTGWS